MAITRPSVGDIIASAWGDAVADAINASAATPWTGLAFNAPWSNYGSGFQLGQYRKLGDMVQVRGLVKATGISGSSQIAILPAGFLPPLSLQFGTDGGGAHALLQMGNDGQLSLLQPSGAAAALNINLSFSVKS